MLQLEEREQKKKGQFQKGRALCYLGSEFPPRCVCV